MSRLDVGLTALRRGQIVRMVDADTSIFCAATELLSDGTLTRLAQVGAGAPYIALTANRAAVLHIPPTGATTICLPLEADLSAREIRDLADPTKDLANPFRGPHPTSKAPVSLAVDGAIKLCKLAQLLPTVTAVACAGDPLNDDIPSILASDPDEYEVASALTLRPVSSAHVPLRGAEDCQVIAYRPEDGGVAHLAIVIGDIDAEEPVLVRLHSECFTGDLLGSLKCDCGEQLQGAIAEIGKVGKGILLYLSQEGRGIGLMNKLRAYHLQDEGFDTIEANERLGFDADERVFLPAAEMLRQLGVRKVRLMTNNPDKVAQLADQGIDVIERVAHEFPSNTHNELYLATKARRSGHYLTLGKTSVADDEA